MGPCDKVRRRVASPRGTSAATFPLTPSESQSGKRLVRDASKRLRVLVVDVHEVVHWGFQAVFTGEAWVERYLAAGNTEDALALARKYEPHVALVDLALGTESGAEFCTLLREQSGLTRVLLLTGSRSIAVHAARSAGASGIVPKTWPIRDIAAAARMVGLGMSLFEPEPSRQVASLSERELQVLDLLAAGATNREIAERLYLSPHTVKDHASTLYRKIHARNRAEALTRAQRLGLIS